MCYKCGNSSNKKCRCHSKKHNKKCHKDCDTTLTYEKIYDDFWPDQTGAIFHQFAWQELLTFPSSKVLEVQKEFVIPVDRILSGTQPSPDSSVYGYNDDGSLDLTGGRAKSYDPNFKEFYLRYHGAKEAKYPDPSGPITQELQFLTPDVIKKYFDTAISYFASRGYSIQGPDTFSKFKDQYIWSYSAGQLQIFNGAGYVALKLIWNDDCHKKVPAYVDLHATANSNFVDTFVLDVYEPDPLKRQNGHGYPLRIPITTDFCGTFQNLYNSQPIAYFDSKCNVLTIHVPETEEGHFLTKRILNVGNQNMDSDYEEHLLSFDASFSLLRRNKCDEIVTLESTSFKCLDLFAQVSENVHIKSKVIDFGERVVPDPEIANPIRAAPFSPDYETIYYTGAVLPKMNGSTPSYDVYVTPIESTTLYVNTSDPTQLPEEEEEGDFPHLQGNNPITKVNEQYSILSTMTLSDTNSLTVASLPKLVLDGIIAYPENSSSTVIPIFLDESTGLQSRIIHEFVHQCQFATGIVYMLPAEGMAEGITRDTIPTNLFNSSNASRREPTVLVRLTRGAFTMMTPEFSTSSTTYGLSVFYTYIRQQFDYNNQAIRRTMDILTSETLGPLLKVNDVPDAVSVFGVNPNGGSAALGQSFSELFGLDIKDIWDNFSICATLLRNNSAIPSKYRMNWPYWIYSTEYRGYPEIYEKLAVNNIQQFADWWEKFDTNAIIPANYGTPYTGQTFLRTLPVDQTSNVRDLTALSFNVPHSTNTITLTITAGEWRLSLVQFTSDGTQVGSWIQDGPHSIVGAGVHVFNVAAHVPAFTPNGNIRLICTHVSFSGTGLVLSDYFQTAPTTGTIMIQST